MDDRIGNYLSLEKGKFHFDVNVTEKKALSDAMYLDKQCSNSLSDIIVRDYIQHGNYNNELELDVPLREITSQIAFYALTYIILIIIN